MKLSAVEVVLRRSKAIRKIIWMPPAPEASKSERTWRNWACRAGSRPKLRHTPRATGSRILSPAEVLAAHRALAREFGNQPERVVAEARRRSRSLETKIEGTPDRYAREAVTFARARNFEREAVVDRRLLMRDALRRAMGRASFAEVNRNFAGRVEKGEFLPARAAKSEVEPRYTIPSMIAAEQEVIRSVLEGQDRVEPISRRERLGRDLDPGLTASQRATVEHVLTSRDRIQGVQGTAGTGKTTALSVIRAIAEGEHYHAEGFAPTSRAAQECARPVSPRPLYKGSFFGQTLATNRYMGRLCTSWMNRA